MPSLDTVSVDIAAGKYLFRASGYTVKFPGFMVLYDTVRDNEDEDDKPLELPPLTVDEPLTAQEITPAQHFTQPPARFTEGSLVKMMEEKGVGRPSTFTSTITTIIARGYVRRNGKVLEPTEAGAADNQADGGFLPGDRRLWIYCQNGGRSG